MFMIPTLRAAREAAEDLWGRDRPGWAGPGESGYPVKPSSLFAAMTYWLV